MPDKAYVISRENSNSLEGRPLKVVLNDETKASDLIAELNETAAKRWESEGMPGKLPYYFYEEVEVVE